MGNITIKNANEHNLKNITIDIPKNKLIAFTGVSGSGKSTIVYDVIFSEAQRQYLDSLSTYARMSMPKFSKPNVDSIEGLSPAIVINQQPLAKNPRSTIGTVTEVYTYLRLLYSRFGQPILNAGDFSFNTPSGACQSCKGTGEELAVNVSRLIDRTKSLNEGSIRHRTWKVGGRLWNIINASKLFDMDKPVKDFTEEELNILLYSEPRQYYNNALGFVQNFSFEGIITRIMKRHNDARGLEGVSYDASFFLPSICKKCKGARVNERARSVIYNGKSIIDLVTMEIQDLLPYIKTIKEPMAQEITGYIIKTLELLQDIGVGYLSLSRSVATLSNGESQRIKLARQLGNSLTDLIYILDEPTAGLHAKDKEHIAKALKGLSQKSNSVLIVEHDENVISIVDYIIDIGPKAGVQGGKVVFEGSYDELLNSNSITGQYISKRKRIARNDKVRVSDKFLVAYANHNNLKGITVNIPKNVLTCITGVSGSGKSSLIEVVLDQFENIIVIDQSPIGSTPRSNPATYTKAFDDIRKVFADTTGQNPSKFAFNSTGACEKCKGLGYEVLNMHFLGDVKKVCEECGGKRYSEEVLGYRYKQKNIADVLDMTIEEAQEFFDNPSIKNKLNLLSSVGLDYLLLGQSLDTLSGGEAQRVKLASGLSKKGQIYVLDEPTRGLHMSDIDRLLALLNMLVESGNTIIVVEHNLGIIKNADWIIDLGPEGGKNGGEIIAAGTPGKIMECEISYTGKYLKKEFMEEKIMLNEDEYIVVVANLLTGNELEIIKSLGYKSLLINSNTWISMEKALEADVPVEVNLNNEEEVMEKVLELKTKYNIKAVFSFNEYRVPIAAKIREYLGLPYGITYEAAINCRNKKKTRRILEALGEEAVKYGVIKSLEEANQFVKENGLPVVIKPSNDAGSQLVFCCKTDAEVEDAVKSIQSTEYNLVDQKLDSEFLIEEFLDGPEFSAEAVAYNGKISVVAITSKKLMSPFQPIEVGHTVPALLSQENEQAIKKLVEKANKLLGINYSVTHTEVKLTRKGPRIVEVNARIGGDNIPQLVELVKGINLYEASVRLALGKDIEYKESVTNKADIRYFIAEHDGYANIKELSPLYQNGKVKMVHITVTDGMKVEKTSNNYNRMGYFISYDETDEYIESMAKLVQVCDKAKEEVEVKGTDYNAELSKIMNTYRNGEAAEKIISDREYAILRLVRALLADDNYKKIRAVIFAKSVGLTSKEISSIYSLVCENEKDINIKS